MPANTVNKSAIRQRWDLPILEAWQDQLKRPLTYFGLPGPEIHDFLDWQAVLSADRTGVEELGRPGKQRVKALEAMALLNLNVARHEMSSGLQLRFQLLRGSIEDIILDGVDADGNSPRLDDGAPTPRRRFRYDIVNLDFDGGFGYRNKHGVANRVNAIKKLFERQQTHSFVLLLTINVRDTLGDEVEDYLAGLSSRRRGEGWCEEIDWHRVRRDGQREYKLKATVSSFVHAEAESRMFRFTCHPPIVYEGHEQARMLHFVFELRVHGGNLRAFSVQDDSDIIALPLIKVQNGQFILASLQPPGFHPKSLQALLSFLPEETRQAIAESLASVLVAERSTKEVVNG